jgi:hypothetical protein
VAVYLGLLYKFWVVILCCGGLVYISVWKRSPGCIHLDDGAGFSETTDQCTINMISSSNTAASLCSNNFFSLGLFFITAVS